MKPAGVGTVIAGGTDVNVTVLVVMLVDCVLSVDYQRRISDTKDIRKKPRYRASEAIEGRLDLQ